MPLCVLFVPLRETTLLQPVTDLHNALIQNCVAAPQTDLLRAIQIHRGNGGWLLLQARPLHRRAGKLYCLLCGAECPTTNRYHSSCPFHIQCCSKSFPSIPFLRGRENIVRSFHACKTSPM